MTQRINKNIGLHPWKQIDWMACNKELLRLQAKLYNALKLEQNNGLIKQIHNEMLMSFACRALAVRKVTASSGGKTAGVDGRLWNRDDHKWNGILWLKNLNWNRYICEPIKRVYIPKNNSSETRPLGIPTIKDRAAQTLWNYILDVHHEHNADPRSFGFRIGRNAKQALSYIHLNTSGTQQKRLILSIDIKKAYDRVLHEWITTNMPINTNVVKSWLNAGIIYKGNFSETTVGLPQGGPISPTIFNMVMNGIESQINDIKFCTPIRFADDIIVLARTNEQLDNALELIKKFLEPRGLEINENKTVIANIETGFKYLGYWIREYVDITRQGKKGYGGKKGIVLIKPSNEAVKSIKQKIKALTKKYANASAGILIQKLNPVLRGWSNYFNGGTWTEVKNKLGYYIWKILYKWVRKKHRKFKGGTRKLLKKYFKNVQRRKTYLNSWTFYGTHLGKELLLVDVQEILVNKENTLKFDESINPYNPESYEYFLTRNRISIIRNIEYNKQKQELLKKQNGLCTMCGAIIDENEKVEIDHILAKAYGGTDDKKNLRLIHATCHKQKTARERRERAKLRKLERKNK
jgi:RNA-directed DNA polymerase